MERPVTFLKTKRQGVLEYTIDGVRYKAKVVHCVVDTYWELVIRPGVVELYVGSYEMLKRANEILEKAGELKKGVEQ